MRMIVYNCIHQLMFESSKQFNVNLRRVSFKGGLQAIRQWKLRVKQTQSTSRKRQESLN